MRHLVILFVLFLVVTFQQCARHNFLAQQSNSPTPVVANAVEDEVLSEGHGTIYTGKPTHYVLPDYDGQCVDSDVLSIVLRESDSFSLIRENCIDIPKRPVERSRVELVNDAQVVLGGQIFFREIYASCFEIYEEGLSAGNGSYLIDPDGDQGDEPFLTYCEMDLIGGLGP